MFIYRENKNGSAFYAFERLRTLEYLPVFGSFRWFIPYMTFNISISLTLWRSLYSSAPYMILLAKVKVFFFIF